MFKVWAHSDPSQSDAVRLVCNLFQKAKNPEPFFKLVDFYFVDELLLL